MYAKIFGTIGLGFDIIGAIFVAFEVVKVHPGYKYFGDPKSSSINYEKKKHIWMKAGLCLLVFGFVLQIVAIWVKC